MLSQEQRKSLQTFVDRNPSGTAYLRRAQILLLADEGCSAETIASEVEVPVARVRQFTRAFKREGLGLFPETISSPEPHFSPDDPIAEAGRKMMAARLDKVLKHEAKLRATSDVASVHETRKGIRRLRTALRLFEPYYEPGVLKAYRKKLRKFMRRLNRSRDIAVFLDKLDRYVDESTEAETISADEQRSLEALRHYWQAQLEAEDVKVSRDLERRKYRAILSDFGRFTRAEGEGVLAHEDPTAPFKTRHVAPILISERVAAVRAFDDLLEDASLARLHALRIQCKELRYTLEFFEPVLGSTAPDAIGTVKQMLIHLGELNDARVHREMLAETTDEELAPAVELYAVAKEAEIEELVDSFSALWGEFDRLAWRQELAAAVAAL